MKKASICAIENELGEILFLDRVKPPFGWGLVGGKVDEGETVEEACIREVFEESGIHLMADTLSHLGTMDSSRGNFELHIFYIKIRFTPIVTLSDEHHDYAWIHPSDDSSKVFVANTHKIIDMINSINGIKPTDNER